MRSIESRHVEAAPTAGLGEFWLYRAFDDAGSLLYIGISGNPGERLKSHRRRSAWWIRLASITFEPFGSQRDALAAERHAIRDEWPMHNKRSARRSGPCEVLCHICESAGL